MGFRIRGKAAPIVALVLGIVGVVLVTVGSLLHEKIVWIMGIGFVVVMAIIFIGIAIDRRRT